MKAQCQCGNVSLEVQHNHEVHACHCGKCRQRAGSASFTLTAESAHRIGASAPFANNAAPSFISTCCPKAAWTKHGM